MSGLLLAVMAALVFGYTVVARRVEAANVTAPMLSLVAGALLFGVGGLEVIETGEVHVIAEVALVVVLFHDASTVRITQLTNDKGVPIRLLAIGFPVALVATWGVTWAVLPALGVAGALLVAASITPTDAGLGAPTILNPVVPVRVRRALNVESGLNDGLATPIVLLALGALVSEEGGTEPTILQVGLVPVALALLLAVVLGLASAWLMDQSADHHWSSHRGRAVMVLALPLLLLGLAEVVGANAFIAAFVGGLTFGAASRALHEDESCSELLEVGADLLGFAVWFFAGGLLLLVFDEGVCWQWVLVAVLAVTLLRLVPVWLSLLGTGFWLPTVAFFGWFGPRGLATIVFALLAVEELGTTEPFVADIVGVLACTVVLSVFAHGLSAGPLSARYGRWVSQRHPPVEREPAAEPKTSRGRVR